MYRILIHLSVLSLLEILFYFYYVGPLESQLFKDSFPSPDVNDDIKPIYINNIYNLTYHNDKSLIKNITDSYIEKSNVAEKKRNIHNEDLFNSTIIYWYVLLSITIFFTIIQLSLKYYTFKKKEDSNEVEIEMTRINNDLDLELDSDLSLDNTNLILYNPSDQKIILTKKNMYFVLKKLVFYLFLFGSILLFEYLFFKNVVLNYHIISRQEFELLILESYLPVINKYIIINNI